MVPRWCGLIRHRCALAPMANRARQRTRNIVKIGGESTVDGDQQQQKLQTRSAWIDWITGKARCSNLFKARLFAHGLTTVTTTGIFVSSSRGLATQKSWSATLISNSENCSVLVTEQHDLAKRARGSRRSHDVDFQCFMLLVFSHSTTQPIAQLQDSRRVKTVAKKERDQDCSDQIQENVTVTRHSSNPMSHVTWDTCAGSQAPSFKISLWQFCWVLAVLPQQNCLQLPSKLPSEAKLSFASAIL